MFRLYCIFQWYRNMQVLSSGIQLKCLDHTIIINDLSEVSVETGLHSDLNSCVYLKIKTKLFL